MQRCILSMCLFRLALLLAVRIIQTWLSSSLTWSYCDFQLEDLHIMLTPRVTLKPLVPSFPCFANLCVSLMEKVLIVCSFDVHLISLKNSNSSYVDIATYRFWTQIVGRRYHGNTRVVSLCSGNCSSAVG